MGGARSVGIVTARALFTAVGALAVLAGGTLWMAMRPPSDSRVAIAPAAIFAASFLDAAGKPQSLGQFQGKVVVLNFWATWCAPCREEMPGFMRLQSRWAARGVQFVGLANEEPDKVARFGRELGINYPLWTGGQDVPELSQRLGNRLGVLPHTAILGGQGQVLEARVGPYAEAQMEERLLALSVKSP